MYYMLFMYLIAFRTANAHLLDALERFLRESDELLLAQLKEDWMDKEYDFIVVGGGTAGATLAARLSEVTEWKVLLLEAGGHHQFYMDVPVLVGGLQNGAQDWQFLTEPSDKYCRGYPNHQCPVPRGKVLGGSSVLNYMLATRGNPKDYDNWRDMGNEGWGWDDVLPYFIKAENMSIAELRLDPLHGTSGPLTISRSKYRTKLAKAFIAAGRELGHLVGDYNGATQNQFSYFQFTKNNGRRASTSRAYLYPVLKSRPNLHVIVNAFVTKLITLQTNVIGVQVEYQDQIHTVHCRKEVIVSAGTINSPQILMLSGIGPQKHLQQFGLPVIQNLPVGQNLQDHVSFAGLFFLTNLLDDELIGTKIAENPKFFKDYVDLGFGPYEVPGGNEGVFFYDIDNPNDPNGYPDIEIHFSTVSPIPEQVVRGFSQEVYDSVYKPYDNNISWAIQPILMHPKSRGIIELASADPHDKVKITPNYLEDPEDVETILKGIAKILDIGNTDAFRKYDSVLNPLKVPGCEGFEPNSDSYWNCLMRVMTITNYHQVGTCSMGPTGVVDARLRVWGMRGVRVADASIMPLVPAAHTNIPSNMIGEKAADIIKQDYHKNN